MAKVVILGAGIAGHTAAMFLRKKLSSQHTVTVVSPNTYYQWIPSNIWVGVGRMKPEQVIFSLKERYQKKGIVFKQALATSIHPEGKETSDPFVRIKFTKGENQGQEDKVYYDYLVNATGPRLNFEATEGLGPEHHTHSVCTYSHATDTWNALQLIFEKMENGERQKLLFGTGHPSATCQGAAFEYALNVAFEVRKRGLNDMAEMTWISNEYELGDFGMGGAHIKRGGYVTSTKIFSESIFSEYGINWITRAGVYKVEPGKVFYETLDGNQHEESFDFSMLIPGFKGVGIKAYAKNGSDITDQIFAANGFMKVDADYTQKPYEEWKAEDWPEVYQNQDYKNIFAPGIAFAPPHPISKPMENPNGMKITPAPPRTGMPSGVQGKIVADNIVNLIKKGDHELKHKASMSGMGAACIISAGYGMRHGTAATMTVFPIVQDWNKFPKYGRNINYTVGEAGLAGHWMKLFMHHMFLYKAKGKPFWYLIPE